MLQDFLRQNGYCLASKMLDTEVCSRIEEAVLQGTSYPQGMIERDSASRPVRLEGAVGTHDVLRELRRAELAAQISILCGQSWVLILNRHNHITVDYGDGNKSTRFHRDALHWTRTYITVVIMLSSKLDPHSWPRIIPGSHLWAISGPPNGGGYWLDEDINRQSIGQALSVPLSVGDALFLDPLTFHAAGWGLPTNPRTVLTLAVRADDELAESDASNELGINGIHIYQGQSRWLQRRQA
jgi:ectoine hydroxylase-related dioxygenase (phytanoyl-CoA dioxygenase family)